MRGKPVSEEQWAQIKKLWNSGLFDAHQIRDMTGFSTGYIYKVKRYPSWKEHNTCELAANKLAAKRREERENEAKKAYEEAVNEVEAINEAKGMDLDNESLRMDIIIEKLDKIIALLTEVRVAQSAPKGIPMPGPKPF